MPTALSSRGLPIGLQLIGPALQDTRLLALAAWLEKRLCFPRLELAGTCEKLGDVGVAQGLEGALQGHT